MVVVAISAIVMSWLRPMGPAEAEKVAEARFLKVPGVNQWGGRYRVHAWPAGSKQDGDGWFVDFTESEGGSLLAQMFVTSKGKTRGVGLAHGKFK
jgi:hypothetical protein